MDKLKLKELPDNSPDIETDNIIQRYQRRPKQLEKMCLADFVAWFNYVKDEHADSTHSSEPSVTRLDDFMPETICNFNDNTDDDPNNISSGMHEIRSDYLAFMMRIFNEP